MISNDPKKLSQQIRALTIKQKNSDILKIKDSLNNLLNDKKNIINNVVKEFFESDLKITFLDYETDEVLCDVILDKNVEVFYDKKNVKLNFYSKEEMLLWHLLNYGNGFQLQNEIMEYIATKLDEEDVSKLKNKDEWKYIYCNPKHKNNDLSKAIRDKIKESDNGKRKSDIK